jgi:4a-hydroxytetrahydrobiopterin dehydratase
MARLDFVSIQGRLAKLPGWALNDAGEITKTYDLSGFPQTLLFVNAVGVLAESAQHHPDILIKYRHVTFSLTTHDAGGLTDKDFDLAAKIDALPLL